MTYDQFLDTARTIRAIFGYREAQKFFRANVAQFKEFDYDGITNLGNIKNQSKESE